MPNWCNNTITIKGSTETVKTLWDDANEVGFLQAMKPMPKELDGTTSPTPKEGVPQPLVDGHDNWYAWRVDNWGTKWDIDVEGLEYKDNGDGTSEITGWADSAWAPPINAFQTLADDMDGLYVELKYWESGMDFIGVWDSEGGDAYYDDVSETVRKDPTWNEDKVLYELVGDFGLEEWFDEMDQEEEEMA